MWAAKGAVVLAAAAATTTFTPHTRIVNDAKGDDKEGGQPYCMIHLGRVRPLCDESKPESTDETGLHPVWMTPT